MNKLFKARTINPDRADVELNLELPRICPHCKTSFAGFPLAAYYAETKDVIHGIMTKAYSVFFCPRCESFFSAQYFVNHLCSGYPEANLVQILPVSTSKISFPENVSELSPKFVEVYNQALSAESSGLDEICGLGFRKSLEFLIKDFAIHKHPEAKESIESAQLGLCINKYISDPQIKTLAERSAWIGNDEAHYVRKHEDRDASDMKSFIQACVHFISMTLYVEDAESMLPKK